MELLSNLSLGFGVALTPLNLLYAFIGCFLGTFKPSSCQILSTRL